METTTTKTTPTPPPTRAEKRDKIYAIINEERDFQDKLVKRLGFDKELRSVEGELMIATYYLEIAKKEWVLKGRDSAALNQMRKAVAVLIRCFENHGVTERYEPPECSGIIISNDWS